MEPELVQLIADLRQLRAKVIEVGADQDNVNELPRADQWELNTTHLAAITSRDRLVTARRERVMARERAYPGRDPAAVLAEAAGTEEASEQLEDAFHAISPGYSVAAIDKAIRVAESQM